MASTNGRDTFIEHINDIWGAFHWLMDQPNGGATQVAHLLDDLAIRDVLTRYAGAIDAGDTAGVMALFSDDSILVTPGPNLIGKAEIERFFSAHAGRMQGQFHRLMNTAVRLTPGTNEGWVGAYVHTPVADDDKRGPHARLGHYFSRLVKDGGTWRIADLRISQTFYPQYAAGKTA